MSEAWAVIPAGGAGQRFSYHHDKLMVHLGGLPLIVRTLETLFKAKTITGAVIAMPLEKKPRYHEIIDQYGHQKPVLFAPGGATRRDSVYNALKILPETCQIAVIHDAARPLIEPDLVDRAVECMLEGNSSGVVVAVPIQDTVKQGHTQQKDRIEKTLDRSQLWRAQTPQIFSKEVILKAHESVAPDIPVTDDAQLLELSGLGEVTLFPGSDRNLKITVPDDLLIAEALLKAK